MHNAFSKNVSMLARNIENKGNNLTNTGNYSTIHETIFRNLILTDIIHSKKR